MSHKKILSGILVLYLAHSSSIPAAEVGWKEGQFLPNIAFASASGVKQSLHGLRGQVVFVNFWASWCPPCIREWPYIQSIYNEFKDNAQVRFVVLNLYEEYSIGEEWVEFRNFTVPLTRSSLTVPGAWRFRLVLMLISMSSGF